MSQQNSILDKIIQSKQIQEATQFNPNELIFSLFKNLSTKERDILNRRFGLAGKEKETLEEIGKYYQITRERIRQVEAATIKKLREIDDFHKQIEVAEHNISRLIEDHGGAMEENHLLEELLTYTDPNPTNRQAALFIISNLLEEKIHQIKSDQVLHSGWSLPNFPVDSLKEILNQLAKTIEQENKLLQTELILDIIKKNDVFKQYQDLLPTAKLPTDHEEIDSKELQKIINAYLTISQKIDKNILGEWGLSHWNTVMPKRMGDKVYLVLRKVGKPLHFNEITQMINESGFDKKIAYPATIHNELILDDRYVLVGRGIYALKEWGYQSGTVIDIITDILAQSSNPLTKEEIIKKVLEQRMVRKSTILLALTNKDKIKKLPDGRYTVQSA